MREGESPKLVSLEDERKRKKRADYAKLVMKAWDDEEHRDKREQRDLAAEVHRKNRETL